jgi:hypothetical protein
VVWWKLRRLRRHAHVAAPYPSLKVSLPPWGLRLRLPRGVPYNVGWRGGVVPARDPNWRVIGPMPVKSILERREWVLNGCFDAAALDAVETCECTDLLVRDGAYVCWECGTVYSVVYGYSRPPRRSNWRSGRPR